ncbi:pheromone A receptor-domain-containing protein [Xylariales sp. PMI_506]|nr:pheromone A receptor-domain-containing protein [Xylariales sp. PMI_506]
MTIAAAPGEGPPGNSSYPSLAANQICRILFAIIGAILCWVPFQILARKGEFAATVLIVDIVLMNLFTVVNSLIWGNDNWDNWWDGIGLCDVEVYLAVPMQTIYASCIFVIMKHLAQRLRIMKASDLSKHERKQRNFLQALIIFPVPIIQLAFTWFDLAQRYVIATLVGCTATYDNSWPKIAVYILPPALFAAGTVPYTYLAWRRFHEISMSTARILAGNKIATSRSQQRKRRLYQMSLSILVPYVPLQMTFLALNIVGSDFHDYDYRAIHFVSNPYPWNSIMLIPSCMVPFSTMNQPWIAILTPIPIVLFFGLNKEATHMYRQFAARIGLSSCFPALLKFRDRTGPTNGPVNDTRQSYFSSAPRTSSEDDEFRTDPNRSLLFRPALHPSAPQLAVPPRTARDPSPELIPSPRRQRTTTGPQLIRLEVLSPANEDAITLHPPQRPEEVQQEPQLWGRERSIQWRVRPGTAPALPRGYCREPQHAILSTIFAAGPILGDVRDNTK